MCTAMNAFLQSYFCTDDNSSRHTRTFRWETVLTA